MTKRSIPLPFKVLALALFLAVALVPGTGGARRPLYCVHGAGGNVVNLAGVVSQGRYTLHFHGPADAAPRVGDTLHVAADSASGSGARVSRAGVPSRSSERTASAVTSSSPPPAASASSRRQIRSTSMPFPTDGRASPCATGT